MKNIDDMRVGDFLYLLDCMQEECYGHKRCDKCRYHDICCSDISSIETISLRETVESYAEMNGLLNHMNYMNNHKWIPVSERLPEDLDNRFYMCILENHEDDLPLFLQYDDELGFGYWVDRFHPQTLGYLDNEFITNEDLGYEKVIAWMEIPEYKGETDNVD